MVMSFSVAVVGTSPLELQHTTVPIFCVFLLTNSPLNIILLGAIGAYIIYTKVIYPRLPSHAVKKGCVTSYFYLLSLKQTFPDVCHSCIPNPLQYYSYKDAMMEHVNMLVKRHSKSVLSLKALTEGISISEDSEEGKNASKMTSDASNGNHANGTGASNDNVTAPTNLEVQRDEQ